MSYTDQCPVCNSKMIKSGFDGDWVVLECANSECQTQVESPVGDPKDEGFTMESLKMASDYADTQ